MRSFPVFIHHPIVRSLQSDLEAIKNNRLFNLHVLKLDQDLMDLVVECKPCFVVFSVFNADSRKQTKELLGHLKHGLLKFDGNYRDPSLRTIIVAEKEGVSLESWQKYGVHEYIISPAIDFAGRLMRHYYKALSADSELDEALIPEHQIELQPETKPDLIYFSEKWVQEKKYILKKFSVEIEIEQIKHDSGQWILAPEAEQDGFEEVWQWSEKGDTAPDKVWRFKGDKPRFSMKKGVWVFKGEKFHLSDWKKKFEIQSTHEGSGLIVVKAMEQKIVSVKKQYYSAEAPKFRDLRAQKTEVQPKDKPIPPSVRELIQFIDEWTPKTQAEQDREAQEAREAKEAVTTAKVVLPGRTARRQRSIGRFLRRIFKG